LPGTVQKGLYLWPSRAQVNARHQHIRVATTRATSFLEKILLRSC
jgi:hypothetical protein